MRWIIFLLVIPAHFVLAQSSYEYSFPKDHFAHSGYQTEWWYYTGHLKTSGGEEYGYELTFFKVAWPKTTSPAFKGWTAKPIYLAHFAISDKKRNTFYYDEKLNRPIGKIAGASITQYHVWNEDWSVVLKGDDHHLTAQSGLYKINLKLTPKKQPVIHGLKGISLKGDEKGNYSYYYSMTRLETEGEIIISGNSFQCKGLSWMDHEWMSSKAFYLGKESPRWDWFSLQLNNNMEIMFYTLRDKNSRVKSASSGTIIFSNQRKQHILLSDIQIEPLDYWDSPTSKGIYPIKWRMLIPKEDINLLITPFFKNQELNTKKSTGVIYWEGAVSVSGTIKGRLVSGQGYVEMTGYAKSIKQ